MCSGDVSFLCVSSPFLLLQLQYSQHYHHYYNCHSDVITPNLFSVLTTYQPLHTLFLPQHYEVPRLSTLFEILKKKNWLSGQLYRVENPSLVWVPCHNLSHFGTLPGCSGLLLSPLALTGFERLPSSSPFSCPGPHLTSTTLWPNKQLVGPSPWC